MINQYQRKFSKTFYALPFHLISKAFSAFPHISFIPKLVFNIFRKLEKF